MVVRKETIIGDDLTLEKHPEYEGEYVARWRGYMVATVAKTDDEKYNITEWHPDGESTLGWSQASSLGEAWRSIQGYTLITFDDTLKDFLGLSHGLSR